MEEIHLQETQLEHDPIFRTDLSWQESVQKIEAVLNDVCSEYEKDGQTKRTMQVSTVTTWRDGVELSTDELESDVPF